MKPFTSINWLLASLSLQLGVASSNKPQQQLPQQHLPEQQPLPSPAYHHSRTIAGVTVVDTPLIRSAETYARAHLQPWAFNHVMRSWLLGALLTQQNETLLAVIDPEVQAVAAILHDLGWDRDPHSKLVSKDKRFEVDGAIAAREFIRENDLPGRWDERRVQLVWDAIALHTLPGISEFKEPEVSVTGRGIGIDLMGRSFGISEKDWEEVNRRFPRKGVAEGVNETMQWLCASKPETTYDTFIEPYGDSYVKGYKSVGNRFFDIKINDEV